MRQRGFTLLELVIGITLLGFLLALAYGGLRLGSRGWESGERSADATARQAVVGDYLRRQLSMIFPLRWTTSEAQGKLAFIGEPQAMRFAAPMAARAGIGGLLLFELELITSGEDKELRLRWRSPDPELDRFDFPEERDQVFLIKGLDSCQFDYFGADTDQADPDWHDTWSSEIVLPTLVRIRIQPKEGDAWPEVVVPLRIDPEAGCRWDSAQRKCLG